MNNGSQKRTLIYKVSKRIGEKERNRGNISDVSTVSLLTQLNEKDCSAKGYKKERQKE